MIAVLDYGIGNLGSAYKALKEVGADAILIDHPIQVDELSGVVLPGVGAFGACMNALKLSKLDYVLKNAIEQQIPVLGICVGMQMLYEGSEESPDVRGLGLLAGRVRKLTGNVKLPHMAWSQLDVSPSKPEALLFEGLGNSPWFYFVHSFAPEVTENTIAECNYGDRFTAACGKGNIFGTQFHPEKSSTTGLGFMRNYMELCEHGLGK